MSPMNKRPDKESGDREEEGQKKGAEEVGVGSCGMITRRTRLCGYHCCAHGDQKPYEDKSDTTELPTKPTSACEGFGEGNGGGAVMERTVDFRGAADDEEEPEEECCCKTAITRQASVLREVLKLEEG